MTPLGRCMLFSVLLWSSLAGAGGIDASAIWFDSGSELPKSWQRMLLARPSRDECDEFARSLPKNVKEQFAFAAFEAQEWYERVCAIGSTHVLIGPGPSENSQSRVLLVEKASARVVHTFTVPKKVRIVWASLGSTSELVFAYNEPDPNTGHPAEAPLHVRFIDPKTGRVLQRLKPAPEVVTTSNERKSTVTMKLETGQELQLPPSGQFCDRITNIVARSPTRTLVFQTCTIFE